MTGVSQAQYAKRRGTSRQAVNKLVSSGRLDPALKDDGTIDAETADRLLSPTASQSDAELKRWKAASAKLQYERAAGELLHRDDVCHAVADLGTGIVEEIGLFAKFAVDIGQAHNTGGEEAARKVTDEAIRETRRAIAERLKSFDPDGTEED